MNNITLKTPNEINTELAKRLRKIRKIRKISQESLASRAGVSLGSLKRFETTGQISLISFTKIAVALGLEGEVDGLFDTPQFKSIEEVVRGQGK